MSKITVTIVIEALSKYDIHKCTITPSVAVNPPAIQYFKGVHHEFCFQAQKSGDLDERDQNIAPFIITMLSDTNYPNPPVLSKTQAEKLAKHLPDMLKKLDHCTKVSLTKELPAYRKRK